MELQERYLLWLDEALAADERLRAAWLTGSLGRGAGDRYSDIDLNLLLDPAVLDTFRHGAEQWLGRLRPLVLCTWMFNGRMANCLTADGLRLDVWLHTEPPGPLDEARVQVLMDRDTRLRLTPSSAPFAGHAPEQMLAQIREFWRCIALVPAATGRAERITSLFGLGIEATLLADVLIAGYGVPRASGIKRLNDYLPPPLRREIEAALAFDGLAPTDRAAAALGLSHIMQREGPGLCARHGISYPHELETAVLSYLVREPPELANTH